MGCKLRGDLSQGPFNSLSCAGHWTAWWGMASWTAPLHTCDRRDVIARPFVEMLSVPVAWPPRPWRVSNLRNPGRSYNTLDLTSETRLYHLYCALWSRTSVLIQHEETTWGDMKCGHQDGNEGHRGSSCRLGIMRFNEHSIRGLAWEALRWIKGPVLGAGGLEFSVQDPCEKNKRDPVSKTRLKKSWFLKVILWISHVCR